LVLASIELGLEVAVELGFVGVLTIGLAADEIRDVDDVEAELTLTVVVGAVLGLIKTNKMSVINLAFTWLMND
jgi:hypothetical protein